jgi:membrane-associated phospholipid phosphatase
MKKAAIIISGIFHPMIMPLVCVLVATKYDWFIAGMLSPEQARVVLLIVGLSTIVFPGINILLLKWYGAIGSLEMPTKKERFAPFASSLFFFGLGYYILRKGIIAESIYAIFFGCILSVVVLFVINAFLKVSAHATGVFGLLGATIGLFSIHDFGNIPLLIFLVFVCGIVLTSRLVLKAHTPVEVYTGALVGFGCLYFTVSQNLFI